MTVYYSLCQGGDLPICRGCRRNVVHHGDAALEPYQAFVFPPSSGVTCANWMPIPRPTPNLPRTDTGD